MKKRSISEEEFLLPEDQEKQATKKRRQYARECRAQLSQKAETLGTQLSARLGFDIFQPGQPYSAPPWLQYLTIDDLLSLLNYGELVEISEDGDLPESDEDAYEQTYLLDFEELARFASLSSFFNLLMNAPGLNLWSRIVQSRAPLSTAGKVLKTKFGFAVTAVNSWLMNNFPEMKLGAFLALLNWGGLDRCAYCPMQTSAICESSKGGTIPLSVYRVELPDEAGHRATPNFAATGAPLWLRNAKQMVARVPTCYYCINCNHPLDQEACGVPLACVFYACEKSSQKKHVFSKLELDLYHPDTTEPMNKKFKYCLRCGVLEVKIPKQEPECAFCDIEPGEKCACKPCKLCKRLPSECRCVECNKCGRCQRECKPCVSRKKECKCKSSSSSFSDSSSLSTSFSSGSD